jgi:hypothetical protein
MNTRCGHLGGFIFAGLLAFVNAGDQDKQLAKTLNEQGIYVETAKPGVVLSGYVDAGYTYNFDGPTGRSLARAVSDTSAKGDFNLNNFKLVFEKPLGEQNDYGTGFRVDLVYGEDASTITTGANSGNTGLASDFAVQQAYVQFRAPVGNGIDFRVGKFTTYLGYEVLERPANMNITFGNLWQNMVPATHTGVTAAYKINDIFDIKGAVVNGWADDSTGVLQGPNDLPADAYGFMGAVNVTSPGANANVQNCLYLATGGESGIVVTNNPDLVYTYNVWGAWQPLFAKEKLLFAFDFDYGGAPNSTQDQSKSGYENWYGLALYAKYQFTDIFSLAGRGEYIYNSDGNKWTTTNNQNSVGTTGPFVSNSNEIYSYTVTAGFDVWEDVLLRCEYRADWGNDWIAGTLAGVNDNSGAWGVSHLAAVQVVYSF